MMKNYKKNFQLLTDNHVYSPEMEHDACGVGLIASTDGKKSRDVVNYGIEALKAVWHRGAVDADGKSGDGECQRSLVLRYSVAFAGSWEKVNSSVLSRKCKAH